MVKYNKEHKLLNILKFITTLEEDNQSQQNISHKYIPIKLHKDIKQNIISSCNL